MKSYIYFLFTLALVTQADVVYHYPFDELDAQWDVEPGWTIPPEGPSYWLHTSLNEVSQTTVLLKFPQECNSVTLNLNTGYHHWGYTLDSYVWLSMLIQLDPCVSDVVVYDESDYHTSWLVENFSSSDSTSVKGTINLTNAGEARILFRMTLEGDGDAWTSYLHWDTWDMSITAHGVVPIERNTWASIKGLF